jgi:23S rRNA (adenine2030-N6)-methyltransferase
MNYRHAYHAGNHADVLKHAVLARALLHLTKKDKPLFFLDAHAGVGAYRLDSEEALKTLEWQNGVGRLYRLSGEPIPLNKEAEALLRPWREIVAALNPPGTPLARYPGSPEFARRVLRPNDRIILNELHPADHQSLAAYGSLDVRIRVTADDAAVAIKANLPPPERRGLILADPPYEREDEAMRAAGMLRQGLRRFATGAYLLWYPVTGDGLSEQVVAGAAALGAAKMLLVELRVRAAVPEGGLAGSGLIIVNPPWPLETELPVLVPALCERLAQTEDASSKAEWLASQRY